MFYFQSTASGRINSLSAKKNSVIILLAFELAQMWGTDKQLKINGSKHYLSYYFDCEGSLYPNFKVQSSAMKTGRQNLFATSYKENR